MENYNKKNINLKDHLNASFDKDNITVSEELINRTLQAIKEDKSPKDYKHVINKKYPFKVRRLVSAAAVVLVLFVGINLLQDNFQLDGNPFNGSKKSDSGSNAESGVAYDTKAEESQSIELFQDSATDSSITGEDADKAFSSEIALEDASAEEPEMNSIYTESAKLFTERYPFAMDQMVSFSVTNGDAQMITITENAEKSRELFSLLNEYTLTVADNDISETWKYKLELETKENQMYTIMIGEGIQVMKKGDPNSTYEYYFIENVDTLISSMDEFFISLK